MRFNSPRLRTLVLMSEEYCQGRRASNKEFRWSLGQCLQVSTEVFKTNIDRNDLTGVFCTSGSEREFTLEERWYAHETV